MLYQERTMYQCINNLLDNGGEITKEDVLQAVEAEGFIIEDTPQNRERMLEVVYTLNNRYDKGKVGKSVELLVRCLIIPRSDKLEVGNQGEVDIRFKLAERFLSVEVKTESGDISLTPIFNKEQWTVENLTKGQKSPYVLYSINGTLQELRLLPTERFLEILSEYKTKRSPVWGMLNPMSKIGKPDKKGNYRVGLQVKPGNCMARRLWLWEALQGEGITLREILEMRG